MELADQRPSDLSPRFLVQYSSRQMAAHRRGSLPHCASKYIKTLHTLVTVMFLLFIIILYYFLQFTEQLQISN